MGWSQDDPIIIPNQNHSQASSNSISQIEAKQSLKPHYSEEKEKKRNGKKEEQGRCGHLTNELGCR